MGKLTYIHKPINNKATLRKYDIACHTKPVGIEKNCPIQTINPPITKEIRQRMGRQEKQSRR